MECLLMVQSGGSFPDVQDDAINLAETAGTEWKWVHLHTSAKKEWTAGSGYSFLIGEIMLSVIINLMEQQKEKESCELKKELRK